MCSPTCKRVKSAGSVKINSSSKVEEVDLRVTRVKTEEYDGSYRFLHRKVVGFLVGVHPRVYYVKIALGNSF